MRQLGDLAIWLGMITIAIGVVYYTPAVADYLTTESRPTVVMPPGRGPGMMRPPSANPPYAHDARAEYHAAR